MSHPFFERHRATLDRAVEAIAQRSYWSAYPESASPKVYGEGAAEAGKAAFDALKGKPFPLEQRGTIGTVGGEVSPYGIPLGETTMLEPNIEGRTLLQPNVSTSYMGTVGLRLQTDFGGFSIVPSVAYSIGKFSNLATTGIGVRSDLTGFHGMLTIRIR